MNEPLRTQRLLACLGDRSRYRVVQELARADRCATDLALGLGLSQSCTTRHLQALQREGIVRSRRLGKRVLFSISDEPRVAALIAWAIIPSPAGHDHPTVRATSILRLARDTTRHETAGPPDRPRVADAGGSGGRTLDGQAPSRIGANGQKQHETTGAGRNMRNDALEDFLL